ncbi:MAG: hypothetical protein ACFB5Z_06020 [Elainellaceae cyanobacterium]
MSAPNAALAKKLPAIAEDSAVAGCKRLDYRREQRSLRRQVWRSG